MNIIKIAHEKGHFATKQTEKNLENEFCIPKVKRKSEICMVNCVPCILFYRKYDRQEILSVPVGKEKTLVHFDHLGPLESMQKNYISFQSLTPSQNVFG